MLETVSFSRDRHDGFSLRSTPMDDTGRAPVAREAQNDIPTTRVDLVEADIELASELASVRRARGFVADMLQASPFVDDAELVTAELVTNAVLHGAPPIVVRVAATAHVVRIEVHDCGAAMPVLGTAVDGAMTGRGLGLVDALAREWRVERAGRGGKVVWAELGGERPSTPSMTAPDDDDVDALLAAWGDLDDPEPVFDVELGDVPTDLLLAAKAHVDNMVREFTLVAAGAGPGSEPVTAELAALVEAVVHSFASARSQVKHQAVEAAARGDVVTHLALRLPASAADAGEAYLAALDEADHHARAERLLSFETPPVHRLFRRWYVEALVARLRAAAVGAPAPVVRTFQQRLVDEVERLAPLRELADRLAVLQKITAELTAATDAVEIANVVVTNAVTAVHAHAARVYALKGDALRMLATAGGGDSELASQYADVPVAADLPGGVALRSGRPVVIRNLADLERQFPTLASSYPDERSLLVAPLVVGEHQLGVLALTFRGESRIDDETQRTFLTTLADVTAQALERANATSVATAALERLRFLSEASVVLGTTLNAQDVLDAVAHLVVPRFADWCLVEVLEDNELVVKVVAHVDASKAAWARTLTERYKVPMSADVGSPKVLRTGNSELLAEVTDAMLTALAVDAEHLEILRRVGMSSALVVPLTGRNGIHGAITMVYAESRRRYDDDDRQLAEDLAHRAALAVETARTINARTISD